MKDDGAGGWGRTLLFVLLVALLVGGGVLLAREHLGRLVADARRLQQRQARDDQRGLAADYRRGLETLRQESALARAAERQRLELALAELQRFRELLERSLREREAALAKLRSEQQEVALQRVREAARLEQRLLQAESGLAVLRKERDALQARFDAQARRLRALQARLERTLTPEEIRKLKEEDR